MDEDSRCPFCDTTFKPGSRTTRSTINKHIKKMAARKTNRGNHPRIGTRAFEEIARQRGFREVALSEDVRKQKEIARKRKWRLKKKTQKDADSEIKLHVEMDVELGVEQQKPQAIDSQILSRIQFAFECLRYVIS
jgi:hypothetical protein